MSSTTAAVPEAPQPIGPFGRVIGVLVNPGATFEDIARKPSWIMPIMLLIIINIAVTAIFSQRVGWRAFMEKQIAQNSSAQQRMQQMTPAQREKTLQTQVKVASIFGYVGGVVGVPIVLLVLAAIFMGIFNATSSAGLDLNTSLGITSHAYLPFAIVGLLGILLMFIKAPDTIDIQNLVASNPGALLSGAAPKWLVSLLTSLDVFTFWVLGLMAFGYSVARPRKIKMGSALTWVLGIWIVWVIVKVGLAAITS
ncbi:MAG TPA: YIP1 family protein [Candidatus Acidoferrales bacterium]|nr:YIP1 family protein [Candidatus Acidoferrales bacterium]